MRKPDKYDNGGGNAVLCTILLLYATHLDQPLELMLHAFGVLVDQVDLEDIGRGVVAVEPHSFLGVNFGTFQDSMDASVLAVGL